MLHFHHDLRLLHLLRDAERARPGRSCAHDDATRGVRRVALMPNSSFVKSRRRADARAARGPRNVMPDLCYRGLRAEIAVDVVRRGSIGGLADWSSHSPRRPSRTRDSRCSAARSMKNSSSVLISGCSASGGGIRVGVRRTQRRRRRSAAGAGLCTGCSCARRHTLNSGNLRNGIELAGRELVRGLPAPASDTGCKDRVGSGLSRRAGGGNSPSPAARHRRAEPASPSRMP